MAGTYWLTILPDTSKLKPAIEASMRGVKIKADFGVDEAKAKKAGRDAAKAAEAEADKVSPKIKPKADTASSSRAGSDAGKRVSDAFDKTADGDKVGRQFGGKMAAGLKSSLSVIGPMLGGLTIFNGLSASISQGLDFTTALNTMAGVTKATNDQLKQVSDTARQLGADVTLPGVSATTAAQAMTELAKGGFDVQQSMDAARGTLQLAGAAGIDAATAATIQADALHAFGLSAKDAGYAADVLANVANASTGEITDFAAGFQQAGAVASQFGLKIDDTAAALGALANQGIKGSDAGTLIKSALLAITDQGKPAQGAIKELGLTLYDAQGRFVGLGSMMDQLGQAAQRMSPEAYQAATNILYGSDAARIAGVAAKDGATGFNALKEAVNRQGGAADMAAAKTRGLPGAWANFQNTLDNVKLSIYDMIQGPLTGLLNKLSGIPDFVSRNSDAFKIIAGVITTIAIPALVKWIATQAIAIGGSIVSGVSSVIGVWASMGGAILNAAAAAGTYAVAIARGVAASIISGLTTMVSAFRNLSIGTRLAAAAQAAFNIVLAANPIGLIVTALVAVGVALWAFFTKTETGRKMWAVIWNSIKTVAGAVFDFLKNAMQVVGEKISFLWNNVAVPAFNGIKNAIETMWNGAKVVWDGFTTALKFVGDKVLAFKDGLVNAFNAVKNVVETVWNAIGGIIDKIGNGIGRVADFLKGAGGAVLNAVGLGGKAKGGMIRYAEGGRIVGPGSGSSDSILGLPAMVRVSNGEYVMNAAATAKYLPMLNLMNTGRVPGFSGGGQVALGNISGAGITTGEQQSMWDAVRTKFPDAVLSSATRTVMTEGHPDYHNAGRAIDISGPSMGAIASWIASTYPDSLELIHSPFGHNIKGGKDVGDGNSYYGPSLMAAHQNHVHWALGKTANSSMGGAGEDSIVGSSSSSSGMGSASSVGSISSSGGSSSGGSSSLSGSGASGKASQAGSDFGKMFVSGVMESIGLDGSVFSNPMEWPTVKSAMAGVNWLGKLLSGGDGSSDGTGVSTVGGFASGAADAVGLGGMLSAIPSATRLAGQSGSPELSPGEFNPAVPGATAAGGGDGMSAFAPADHAGTGAAPGPVDNSINITGNVGMNPADVQNKIHTEQNARVRTYAKAP